MPAAIASRRAILRATWEIGGGGRCVYIGELRWRTRARSKEPGGAKAYSARVGAERCAAATCASERFLSEDPGNQRPRFAAVVVERGPEHSLQIALLQSDLPRVGHRDHRQREQPLQSSGDERAADVHADHARVDRMAD